MRYNDANLLNGTSKKATKQNSHHWPSRKHQAIRRKHPVYASAKGTVAGDHRNLPTLIADRCLSSNTVFISFDTAGTSMVFLSQKVCISISDAHCIARQHRRVCNDKYCWCGTSRLFTPRYIDVTSCLLEIAKLETEWHVTGRIKFSRSKLTMR